MTSDIWIECLIYVKKGNYIVMIVLLLIFPGSSTTTTTIIIIIIIIIITTTTTTSSSSSSSSSCCCIPVVYSAHTHTHTHIYIYIYIQSNLPSRPPPYGGHLSMAATLRSPQCILLYILPLYVNHLLNAASGHFFVLKKRK